MNAALLIDASYFIAAFLFIYGLKRMSSPLTARSGIVVAGAGMVLAVLASFLYTLDVSPAARPQLTTNLVLAVIALALGLGWAWRSGKKVAMTEMPQMVALYNGMGGGAAAAIAAIELIGYKTHGSVSLTLAVLGGVIGAVSLSGSLIAWAKLDGRINSTLRFSGLQAVNGSLLLLLLALGAYIVWHSGQVAMPVFAVFFALALLYGVMMTMPIGGADMPVVISLYNAFTGLAVGFEGYVLNNPALMIAGMVVGSAGSLLTLLMAKAMNRSVANVLFSNFGAATDDTGGEISGSQKPIDAADAGINMHYATKVIIAPGYGLAVAQAQHKLYELVKLLLAGKAFDNFMLMRDSKVLKQLLPQLDKLLKQEPEGKAFQLATKALQNTDQRVEEDKPVTPAFIFAALLWYPVEQRAEKLLVESGLNEVDALNIAMMEVLDEVQRSIAIPKRFSLTIKDIWFLQSRLSKRAGRRAFKLMEQVKFRGAYDFLQLRAQAEGGELLELANWWQRFQSDDEAGREILVQNLGKEGIERRPRRRRPPTKRRPPGPAANG